MPIFVYFDYCPLLERGKRHASCEWARNEKKEAIMFSVPVRCSLAAIFAVFVVRLASFLMR